MKRSFLLVLLVCLLPLTDFFKPGLPVTHDGSDHVVRLASFYQSLAEGNLVPRWAGNLNWGYGHPVVMFFYPLPNYLGSLFHFFGLSFIDSVKAVFVLSFVLSGIFMYWWVKEHWGERAGLAAAVVWLLAPYRLVDLYVRGAIGECLAFAWPPLIGYLALKLSKTFGVSYLIGGSLALAALILSHNALSLMYLPVVAGYLAYLVLGSARKRRLAINYLLLAIFGFAISAFFWLPAFFEAKYTLRDIVMRGNFTGFESLARLFWSSWNFAGSGSFSVQVGAMQWLIILLSFCLVWRYRRTIWLLLAFTAAVFLILPVSNFVYQRIDLLQKFQFAWRFLALAIFPPAILAGFLTFILSKKYQSWLVVLILILAIFLNRNYWRANDFIFQTDDFYSQRQANTTNDTGESAPRWSIRRMEKFPEVPLTVIKGEAKIEVGGRKSTVHNYEVAAREKARLVENTLYFPGWQVLVDGRSTEVEFQDPAYRGLMTFWAPRGEHQLVIKFTETRLRKMADLVSILGGVVLLGIGIIKRRK